MSNEFRETVTRSWTERVAQSVGGAVFGLFLFFGCIALLWWNEGRAVDRSATLAAGRNLVMSVPSDRPDAGNDGKLVHVSGTAGTKQTLEDPVFRVRAQALRLVRIVEMYQWVEDRETRTVKQLGGGEREETVYRYRTEWRDAPVDSAAFKLAAEHRNPPMRFRGSAFQAADIAVGAFRLGSRFRDMLYGETDFPLADAVQAGLPPSLAAEFQVSGTELVKGDPASPQVGDLRVRYTWIAPTQISVVGRQDGANLGPYRTKTGTLELLSMEAADADTMFAAAEDENTILTWLLRLGGIVFLDVGFALLLGPLARLADVVPMVGTLIGGGIALVAAVVGLAVGFTTIGLAWLAYRPVLALGLLAVSAAAIAGAIALRRRRTAPSTP
ncbi:MAG: TMEM43 family protein [Alphaproteobacteria bacterium]